jgi:hypothetical protein
MDLFKRVNGLMLTSWLAIGAILLVLPGFICPTDVDILFVNGFSLALIISSTINLICLYMIFFPYHSKKILPSAPPQEKIVDYF